MKSVNRGHFNVLSNFTLKHCRNQYLLKGINGLYRLRYFRNQYVDNEFNSEAQFFGKRKSFNSKILKPRKK